MTGRAKGSHAPSLRTLVLRVLRREIQLPRGAHVLAACSGGPDSTAMLHVLATLREEVGFTLTAHGVDHQLRRAADGELDVARSAALSFGVPFDVTRVVVERGSNLQARAREARYTALRAAMAACGATFLATAHTADDRAETVLMRLLRGASFGGLAVLPPRSGDLLRPLVRARRSDVLLHLRRNNVVAAHDPSNQDPRFLRVAVRSRVMPVLEELSPRIVETLARLADESGDATARGTIEPPLAGLPRKQREQLESALLHGAKVARARTTDHEEVLVALEGGTPVITRVSSPHTRRRSPGFIDTNASKTYDVRNLAPSGGTRGPAGAG
ncbi:MAG: tRNA lysidine(34) synthetase TilS [Polyangiaceae bacterium]